MTAETGSSENELEATAPDHDGTQQARPRKVLLDIGEPNVPLVTSAFVIAVIIMTAWEFIKWGLSPTAAELSRAGGWGLGAFAQGSWSKAITANLLHGGLVHVAMNLFVIYLVGRWLEHVIGRMATLGVIMWGMIFSSVGALLLDAAPVTIGASGVAFALVGAGIVADPHRRTILGSISIQLGVLNFVLTFLVPGISKGGHLGGLVAGVIAALLFWRRNRSVGTDGEVASGSAQLGVTRAAMSTVITVLGSAIVMYLLVAPPAPPAGIADRYHTAASKLVERSLNSNTFGTEQESFKPSNASCDVTKTRGSFACSFDVNGAEQSDQYVVFDRTDQMRILGAAHSPPE